MVVQPFLHLSLSPRVPSLSLSLSAALTRTATNTISQLVARAVSLSIERGECSCAMHVQQPQPRRPREAPSRPGLAWPWSRLINRIPMMFHPVRIIIRGLRGACDLRVLLGTATTDSRKGLWEREEYGNLRDELEKT